MALKNRNRLGSPSMAAWGTVAIFTLFTFVSYEDRQIISLLVAPLKHAIGLTDTQISLVQGVAFALCYSCAGIPIGIAADRYSRRHLLFAGILVFSMSSAACGLVHSFGGLFFCRLLVGIGEAVITPVALSVISDNFARDRLSTAMGVFGMSPYIGFGGALILGGAVIRYLNAMPVISVPVIGILQPWQATFLITALPGIPLAFLAFALRDPRAAGRQELSPLASAGFRSAFRGRGPILGYFMGGFGLLSIISYVTLAWTPAFFMRRHGWEPGRIGLYFGPIIMTSGIAGSLAFGQLITRLVRRGMTDAYFFVPATSSLIALPFFAAAYLIANPWATLGCIAFGYLMLSSTASSSYASLQLIVPRSARARASSLYVFVVALCGAALGPLMVAIVTDYVLIDEKRVGESLAIVLVFAAPAGCAILFAGRGTLRRILRLPEDASAAAPGENLPKSQTLS